jgi:TRAP-type mannitol/chloroaromatic compound transport system substrate-binding protein
MLKGAAHSASSYFNKLLLANNELVLEKMIEGGTQLHKFPDELLKELEQISKDVLIESCSKDEFAKKVMKSYLSFLDRMMKWGPMSGAAMWHWREKNLH